MKRHQEINSIRHSDGSSEAKPNIAGKEYDRWPTHAIFQLVRTPKGDSLGCSLEAFRKLDTNSSVISKGLLGWAQGIHACDCLPEVSTTRRMQLSAKPFTFPFKHFHPPPPYTPHSLSHIEQSLLSALSRAVSEVPLASFSLCSNGPRARSSVSLLKCTIADSTVTFYSRRSNHPHNGMLILPSSYDDRDYHRGGESYRPSDRGGRSPPRLDSYRGGARSPPRRQRSPYDSSYSRGGRGDDRRRSRSPIRRSPSPSRRSRGDDHSYRVRDRTPPRLPERRRSPIRRRPTPSPPRNSNRDNSPPRRRPRDPTPPSSYRQRSPPPRQGRYNDSDRDGYSRSYQARDEPRRFPKENNYRPRERSRTPPRHSAHNSRGETPLSSRRSSPRPHADRARMVDRGSPGHTSLRQDPPPSDRRSPAYRSREHSPPPPRRAQSPPLVRSPARESLPRRERERERERTPPPREREPPLSNGVTPIVRPNAPPSSSFERAPPSGPSSSRYDNFHRDPAPAFSGQSPSSASPAPSSHVRPPTGPSSRSTPISVPTQPRGNPYVPRESGYGEGRGRHFNGPPPRQPSHDGNPMIPTGPRGGPGAFNPGPSHFVASRGPPPFRSNNSTSTTYPRTQRFNSHLSGGPTIIEGGKKLPSVFDPDKEKKLLQLEEDKKKLMVQIEEKQRLKRQGLREWEKAERESARESLRSELAEGHLERLSGEVGAGGGY